MKKNMVLGTLITSVCVLQSMSGCGITDVITSGLTLNEARNKEMEKAKESGMPAQELDALMEEAFEWIAEVAPNHPDVVGSDYMKVFVLGGTVNRSNAEDGMESVTDNEVASRTSSLFTKLGKSRRMNNNFIFVDRMTDFGLDLHAVTGDLSQYDDALGRGNTTGPDEYHPEDIYLVKLSFDEIQNFDQKPSTLRFNLTAKVEWGGNSGERLFEETFESTLVFDKDLWGGSWKQAE